LTNSSKNLDIQILRAIAVLAVMVHHSFGQLFLNYPNWISHYFGYFNGGAGVDLFFVISGFVIGVSFLPAMLNDNSRTTWQVIKSFWVRRIFRIFPLPWSWLFLLLLAAVFINTSGAFGSVQANIEATFFGVFQIANYRFEQCFMRCEYGASFVYWSLSLEEQFYLALPIIVLICRQYSVHVLILLLIYKLFSEFLSYHFAFRFEGLILGVLLSQFSLLNINQIIRKKLQSIPINFIRCLTFFLIVFIFYICNKQMIGLIGSWGFKLAAIVSCVIVWLASYDVGCIIVKGNFKRCLLWIGERSFALYLIHIPAFLLARELAFRYTGEQQFDSILLQLMLSISLLLLLTECSYRFIEIPWRLKGIEVSKKILN
jgi:peptidoglycan/LPS O-acetylase OafA/YrhL